MEAFDYLVGLVSIIIGLGLAEVAARTNLLLRSAGAKHDPLVFGPPMLVAIMLVAAWFDVWAVREIPNLFGFPFFVGIFAQLMVLYLLAAASVPETEGSSMRVTAENYEQNRPYFWRLFTVYELMYVGFWVFFQIKKGTSGRALMERAFTPSGSALPLVVGTVMLLTRNRLIHSIGLILLIMWLFAGYWSYSIG